MTLSAAIKLAKFKRCKLKNTELRLHQQDAKSLIYWLFTKSSSKFDAVLLCTRWLNSDDWQLDE